MTTTQYDLQELLVQFSNYDQQVDVVCCWHGRFEEFVGGCEFDHYPVIAVDDDRTVTPDFLVDFGHYTLVGEICRLPRQATGFAASVEQAKSYLALGPDVDVLMLVPHSYAAESEKRMIDEHLLGDEQVVVTSFVRNDGDAKPCWVFLRATQLRDPSFRDAFLGDKSLHQTLTMDMTSIRIPLHYCFGQRIRYPFMNDDPPAIYTACYLWQYVFSEMLSPDEYVERLLQGAPLDIGGLTVETIIAVCNSNGVKMRPGWVREALALLLDADLAASADNEHYTIAFGKLRARAGGSREIHRLIAERLSKKNVADLDAPVPGQIPGQIEFFSAEIVAALEAKASPSLPPAPTAGDE